MEIKPGDAVRHRSDKSSPRIIVESVDDDEHFAECSWIEDGRYRKETILIAALELDRDDKS